jgi:flagellar hook assembly protein FlgD
VGEEVDTFSLSPENYHLYQNYPNPFNPSTKITFTVHGSQFIVRSPIPTTLKIYNVRGELVRTLVNEPKRPGIREVIWDGKDEDGNSVASGIYFYQLKTDSYCQTRKMILLK